MYLSNAGLYMTCYPDCPRSYFGETSRNLPKRINEHWNLFMYWLFITSQPTTVSTSNTQTSSHSFIIKKHP